MSQQIRRILRKPEVLNRTGYSKSTLHTRVNSHLFVPSISLGDRAVGWLESEVDTVLAAMIAGQSTEEIKALVISLVERRKEAMKMQ